MPSQSERKIICREDMRYICMKMLEPRKWKQAILSLIFLMFYAILMLSLGLLLNAINISLTSA